MWFRQLTAQNAFVLASLFLTSGVSVAAISSNPDGLVSVSVTTSSVADLPTTTLIPTTGADGKPTFVSTVCSSTCQSKVCREGDEDEPTTDEWVLPNPIAGSESLESVPVIRVPSDGSPDNAPSQTTNQPATQAKRAPTATKSDDRYKKLHEALGKTPEVGKGYAIKIRSERNEVSGKSYPDHYLIVAGYVTQRTEGNTVILEFDSGCYDIQLENGKTIKFTDRTDTTWYSWSKAKYEVLGQIKSGLTYVEIEREGTAIAAEMNKKGYNLLTNNCRNLVLKLYKKIKA